MERLRCRGREVSPDERGGTSKKPEYHCDGLSASMLSFKNMRERLLCVRRMGAIGRLRCFVEQLLAIMPDEEHFFFAKGLTNGHTSEKVFACVTEGANVIF